MPLVTIDGYRSTGFDTFHDVFQEVFGFPDYYGRNLDAWIEWMTYLDDRAAGMTSIHGSATDPIVLHIENISEMPEDVFAALSECSAFVNWRRIETGEPSILSLSYRR